MINFYLENVFIITVFVIGSFFVLPVLTVLILRKNGLQVEDRPDIERWVTYIMFILLIAGFIIPLIIMVLLKMLPNAITDLAPLSIYFISFFIICFVFINVKRFKAIERKNKYRKNNDSSLIEAIEKEIQECDGGLMLLIIFISYFSILLGFKL